MKLKTTKDVTMSGIKLMGYGFAGTGKTYTCSTGLNALIISAESGLLSLSRHEIDYVEVKSLAEMTNIVKFLRESASTKYDWVCVDSLSEIAESVLGEEMGMNKDGRKAYGETLTKVMSLARSIRDLPINVYMTAKMERVKDELSGAMLYHPAMPGQKLGSNLPYLFDMCFALRAEKNSEGQIVRKFQTQPDGQYYAKDRSGLFDMFIEPNLSAIADTITRGITK